MPIFVHVTNPLKPLVDFKPENLSVNTVRGYLTSKEIEESGIVVIVDGSRVPPEKWEVELAVSSRVIVTPDVGYGAVIALIVLVIVAIALYFFMPGPPPLASTEEADSVYTLKGQKNQKRLGQAIEKHYGRMRVWPSYMAAPFTKFKNDDQYLYALLCLGLGKYEIHNIKIEDSPIEDFEDVEYVIYQPGERVRHFPTNVQTSTEVGGIELYGENEDDWDGWAGPFSAASPGSIAHKLEVDISFRNGLYWINTEGKLRLATCQILFQCREIDNNGDPVGAGTWVDMVNGAEVNTYDLTNDSVETIRRTFSFDCDDGRYEVRARRTNDKNLSIKYRDSVHWEGLRSFNDSEQNFGNVTLLAIVAKATNNLNDSSKSAFNVELTSILPVYDIGTEEWEDAETRNPAWAFCDVMRANYGKNIGTRFLDMSRLCALADDFEDASLWFDGTFDTAGTVWPSLQQIMSVGRAVPIMRGGLISAVRDVPNIVPTLGFSGNNIVRNSMAVTTRIVNHSEHDGIEVEYLDSTDWKRKTVICLVGTDRGVSLKQVKLLGCTNRNKAYRWGMYQRAVEIYQTDNFTFETGIEGGTAVFGDLIAVKHETLPSENDFVEMNSARLAHDALQDETFGPDTFTTIQLPFVPVFEVGETYRIALRDKIGTINGPYACTEHPTIAGRVVLEVELTHNLFEVPTNAEAALYWFGISGSEYTLAKITKIEPGGTEDTVKITAVPYDDRIYSFDSLTAPAEGEELEPLDLPTLPVVTDVKVKFFPNSRSEAVVSWKPALGATSYVIERSVDGVKYQFVGRSEFSGYVISVAPGDLWVRVRGVNKGAGPWDVWTDTLADYDDTPEKIEEIKLLEEVDDSFEIGWDSEANAKEYVVKVYQGISTNPNDFVGSKIIKINSTNSIKALKRPRASFHKTWLKSKTLARDLGFGISGESFGRIFTFTVMGRNDIGNGPVSEPFWFEKPDLFPFLPITLAHVNTSGNNFDISWVSPGHDERHTFKVWSSTVSGSYPPGMTLRKTTGNTSSTMTITGARPTYWRVQVLDDWDAAETEFASNQKTIT